MQRKTNHTSQTSRHYERKTKDLYRIIDSLQAENKKLKREPNTSERVTLGF